mmetsp:Transcript_88874/g.267328  ORF Transcript_88874/g.267328 Transcript_88874/m.267328 type:complete len:211 (+) Transcript_88874:5474-6106(+)
MYYGAGHQLLSRQRNRPLSHGPVHNCHRSLPCARQREARRVPLFTTHTGGGGVGSWTAAQNLDLLHQAGAQLVEPVLRLAKRLHRRLGHVEDLSLDLVCIHLHPLALRPRRAFRPLLPSPRLRIRRGRPTAGAHLARAQGRKVTVRKLFVLVFAFVEDGERSLAHVDFNLHVSVQGDGGHHAMQQQRRPHRLGKHLLAIVEVLHRAAAVR